MTTLLNIGLALAPNVQAMEGLCFVTGFFTVRGCLGLALIIGNSSDVYSVDCGSSSFDETSASYEHHDEWSDPGTVYR